MNFTLLGDLLIAAANTLLAGGNINQVRVNCGNVLPQNPEEEDADLLEAVVAMATKYGKSAAPHMEKAGKTLQIEEIKRMPVELIAALAAA